LAAGCFVAHLLPEQAAAGRDVLARLGEVAGERPEVADPDRPFVGSPTGRRPAAHAREGRTDGPEKPTSTHRSLLLVGPCLHLHAALTGEDSVTALSAPSRGPHPPLLAPRE